MHEDFDVLPGADTTRALRHMQRKTVHYASADLPWRLACGKPISAKHEEGVGDPREMWPRCKDCFPLA